MVYMNSVFIDILQKLKSSNRNIDIYNIITILNDYGQIV